MLGERLGGLSVYGALGDGGELVESRVVEVEEGGAWGRVREESCETGGCAGLEVFLRFHGGEEPRGCPHCVGLGDWTGTV